MYKVNVSASVTHAPLLFAFRGIQPPPQSQTALHRYTAWFDPGAVMNSSLPPGLRGSQSFKFGSELPTGIAFAPRSPKLRVYILESGNGCQGRNEKGLFGSGSSIRPKNGHAAFWFIRSKRHRPRGPLAQSLHQRGMQAAGRRLIWRSRKA